MRKCHESYTRLFACEIGSQYSGISVENIGNFEE